MSLAYGCGLVQLTKHLKDRVKVFSYQMHTDFRKSIAI